MVRGHKRNDELIGDYCDGEACKAHPLFSQDHQALQILLFYDDLEVVNPLGSHTKVHKLGKVFVRHRADNHAYYFSGFLLHSGKSISTVSFIIKHDTYCDCCQVY